MQAKENVDELGNGKMSGQMDNVGKRRWGQQRSRTKKGKPTPTFLAANPVIVILKLHHLPTSSTSSLTFFSISPHLPTRIPSTQA
eukprot:1159209-Pelagomonas_calceolata.AAC.3